MKKTEATIIEGVRSFLGLDHHDYSKINRLDLGGQHVQSHISELFKLKAAELIHHDSIVSAFNKTQQSMYLDDATFATTFMKEMVGRAVPKPEVEDALKYADEVLDKATKEFDGSNVKDAGHNPNLKDIKEVSQPEQSTEIETVKPRKGHEQKSNIKSDMPIDRKPGKRITESEEMQRVQVEAQYLRPGDYLPFTKATIVEVIKYSLKMPKGKVWVVKELPSGGNHTSEWGRTTKITVERKRKPQTPVAPVAPPTPPVTETRNMSGSSYNTTIEIETPHELISADVALEFNAESPEPRTHEYPGSPGGISIYDFKLMKLDIYDQANYMEQTKGRYPLEHYQELIKNEIAARSSDLETEIGEHLSEQNQSAYDDHHDRKRDEMREEPRGGHGDY